MSEIGEIKRFEIARWQNWSYYIFYFTFLIVFQILSPREEFYKILSRYLFLLKLSTAVKSNSARMRDKRSLLDTLLRDAPLTSSLMPRTWNRTWKGAKSGWRGAMRVRERAFPRFWYLAAFPRFDAQPIGVVLSGWLDQIFARGPADRTATERFVLSMWPGSVSRRRVLVQNVAEIWKEKNAGRTGSAVFTKDEFAGRTRATTRGSPFAEIGGILAAWEVRSHHAAFGYRTNFLPAACFLEMRGRDTGRCTPARLFALFLVRLRASRGYVRCFMAFLPVGLGVDASA